MRTMQVYYDYDGVFGDTMNPAIKEMKEKGLYETEEGRTKYFRELNWAYFLKKTPFITNSPETIKTLMDNGYKVSFLTHVNSLDEYIDKIRFIKNIKELNNIDKIDVIAVPRVIDKSVTINPNGNILIDDRLENIIAWEEMGGIGVLFSDKQHDEYITIAEPMDLVNIVLSLDKSEYEIFLTGDQKRDEILLRKVKAKSSKVPADNDQQLAYIASKLKRYNLTIRSALKYHTSIIEHHVIDHSYDVKKMEDIIKTLDYYIDLVNKKRVSTYKFSYSIYYDLLDALLQLEVMNVEKEKTLTLNNKKKHR